MVDWLRLLTLVNRKRTINMKNQINESKKRDKKEEKESLPVVDLVGKQTKTIQLPKKFFQVTIKPGLIAQYVRVYLNNQRQGTASSKTRGEVKGSTRKIYRQKGTGRARHGDIKAPIFVGGGVAHGPKPRDYRQKLNQKQKKLVMIYAFLTQKKEGNLIIIPDQLFADKPKTKLAYQWLDKLNLIDKKSLLVFENDRSNNNLIYAVKNLPMVELVDYRFLNPYQLLKFQKIIFTEKALLNFVHKLEKNYQ